MGKTIMNRMGAFFAASWAAAALLYFGQHSLPLTVLSGVVVLAGFDLSCVSLCAACTATRVVCVSASS
ncbi:hypothetical protein, partial [Ralstonia pseudosolanacearum]|uniref:hypothetical protein n=1 Tax=Ralstonia pseudosolanacearum TaxID=1310165 RepID=UPI003221498A